MKTLLLVHLAPEERSKLESLLDASSWRLLTASTLTEARQSLQQHRAPIVIYDRDVPGATWQDAVRELHRASRGCIILLSRVSDEFLFREVVHCGGFDVLPKPIQKSSFDSVLKFATIHIRAQQTA